jgi:hypothetical protein
MAGTTFAYDQQYRYRVRRVVSLIATGRCSNPACDFTRDLTREEAMAPETQCERCGEGVLLMESVRPELSTSL